jgi:hypothetical protein
LRRPVIGTGNTTIDVGATDAADATAVARAASGFDGVKSVDVAEIRGRVRRWLLRQHLAGNYAPGRDGGGSVYWHADVGGHHGGGGGDGGGHHGGGGHGGH